MNHELPVLAAMLAGTVRPRAAGWEAWSDSPARIVARAIAEDRPLAEAFASIPKPDAARLADDLLGLVETGAATPFRVGPHLDESRRRCVEMVAACHCDDYAAKRITLEELKSRIAAM